MKLLSKPTGNIFMPLAFPEGHFSVTPESLTFRPGDWGEKTVTVTQIGDASAASNEAIVHGIDGEFVAVLRVILLPNPPEIVLSAREFSVERGGAVVYTARLAARPEGNVEVQVGQEGGCNLILSPDTLTFTSDSWNTQQTVTARVRGSTTPGDCTISHTATIGGTGENVITLEAAATIAVTDNLTQPTRVQSLLVPATLTLAEDSTFQYDLDVDPGGGTPSNGHVQQRQ